MACLRHASNHECVEDLMRATPSCTMTVTKRGLCALAGLCACGCATNGISQVRSGGSSDACPRCGDACHGGGSDGTRVLRLPRLDLLGFASRNRNRRQPDQQPQHAQQPLYCHIAIHVHFRCRPAEVCAEEATARAQRYVAQLRKRTMSLNVLLVSAALFARAVCTWGWA